MHMWHHVTNHLIISTDKDSNSENRIKLHVRDTEATPNIDMLSPLSILLVNQHDQEQDGDNNEDNNDPDDLSPKERGPLPSDAMRDVDTT
jgi:hypothetical protein